MTSPSDAVENAASSDAIRPAAPAGTTLLTWRQALGAAVLAGVLYWAAYPGLHEIWPLTFVAWVPLMVAVQGRAPKQAALLGWSMGVVTNFLGFFWLGEMLETFSGFPLPLCLLFLLLVCLYQGARFGLLTFLYARATRLGWARALILPGAFVASELCYPLLFPWYYGATVVSVPLLAQVADLGGPIFVGLVLFLVNAALALPLVARLERRKLNLVPTIAGAAALVFTLAYGGYRVTAVDAAVKAAPAARVGVVQANMGLLEKRADFQEGLRRHQRLSHDLKERGADFLVWSETSVMRAMLDDSYRRELYPVVAELGLPAVLGVVIAKRVDDVRRAVFFNSIVTSRADGSIASRYDKRDLLEFGEYLPLGETFPILYEWSPNSGRFSKGTSLEAIDIDIRGERHSATGLVCLEDILPRAVNRAVAHAKSELIVNLTNDAWFLDTAAPWQHFALARMRAIEHHRFFVRGTNSGVSAVVDPVGRVVAVSGTFREETLLAKIHWLRGTTLYEIIGDWPWLLISAFIAFASLRSPPRQRVIASAGT